MARLESSENILCPGRPPDNLSGGGDFCEKRAGVSPAVFCRSDFIYSYIALLCIQYMFPMKWTNKSTNYAKVTSSA